MAHPGDTGKMDPSSPADVAVVLGALAALLLLVFVPARFGVLRRNVIMGVRTRAAMADDDSWRIINAAVARVVIPWSLGLAGAALLLWLLSRAGRQPPGLPALVAILLIAFAIHLVAASSRAERLLPPPSSVRHHPNREA